MKVQALARYQGRVDGPVTLIHLDAGETLTVTPEYGRAIVLLVPPDDEVAPVAPPQEQYTHEDDRVCAPDAIGNGWHVVRAEPAFPQAFGSCGRVHPGRYEP